RRREGGLGGSQMNCRLRSKAGRPCGAARCAGGRVRLLVSLFLVLQCCGGCASIRAWRESRLGPLGEGDVRQRLRPAELDELTRAFADRYVGLLSSTSDALKKDNPDAVQRREAQELVLNCATNVYDIASNADAFTRTLDLLVVTELV